MAGVWVFPFTPGRGSRRCGIPIKNVHLLVVIGRPTMGPVAESRCVGDSEGIGTTQPHLREALGGSSRSPPKETRGSALRCPVQEEGVSGQEVPWTGAKRPKLLEGGTAGPNITKRGRTGASRGSGINQPRIWEAWGGSQQDPPEETRRCARSHLG